MLVARDVSVCVARTDAEDSEAAAAADDDEIREARTESAYVVSVGGIFVGMFGTT